MSRYIEVDTACNKLHKRLADLKMIVPPIHYGEVVHSASLIERFIKEQPVANVVERKYGKNISEDGFLCSVCTFGDFGGFHGYEPNFCPNCGAEIKND